MELLTSPTPRRSFLGRTVLAASALVAGKWSPAEAQPVSGSTWSDAWTNKITGKHRQFFDAVSPNDGFAVVFALNFLDGMKEAHPDDSATAAVGFRHFAIALAFNDAIWAKYPLAEILGIKDPATNAPATRNIFRDHVEMRPGMTYEQVMTQRGVVMTACNMALTFVANIFAEKTKQSPDVVRQELINGLLPGIALVPSGVYAVNKAQEKGCTYCYAG